MRHGATQFYIHALIALCLILTGLSPACHAKSTDTSFIEICKADGSVATVEVPANLDPFTDNTQKKHPPKAQKECGFCFAQTHINADLPPQPYILAATQTESKQTTTIQNTPSRKQTGPHKSRAPPILFV